MASALTALYILDCKSSFRVGPNGTEWPRLQIFARQFFVSNQPTGVLAIEYNDYRWNSPGNRRGVMLRVPPAMLTTVWGMALVLHRWRYDFSGADLATMKRMVPVKQENGDYGVDFRPFHSDAVKNLFYQHEHPRHLLSKEYEASVVVHHAAPMKVEMLCAGFLKETNPIASKVFKGCTSNFDAEKAFERLVMAECDNGQPYFDRAGAVAA